MKPEWSRIENILSPQDRADIERVRRKPPWSDRQEFLTGAELLDAYLKDIGATQDPDDWIWIYGDFARLKSEHASRLLAYGNLAVRHERLKTTVILLLGAAIVLACALAGAVRP